MLLRIRFLCFFIFFFYSPLIMHCRATSVCSYLVIMNMDMGDFLSQSSSDFLRQSSPNCLLL